MKKKRKLPILILLVDEVSMYMGQQYQYSCTITHTHAKIWILCQKIEKLIFTHWSYWSFELIIYCSIHLFWPNIHLIEWFWAHLTMNWDAIHLIKIPLVFIKIWELYMYHVVLTHEPLIFVYSSLLMLITFQ